MERLEKASGPGHLASPGAEDHGLNFLVHAGLEDLLHSRGQGSRDSRVLGALEVVGLRDWGQWWV